MNVADQSRDNLTLDTQGSKFPSWGSPLLMLFTSPHSDSSHTFEKQLGNMANIVANSPAHHVYSGVTGGPPVILEKSLSSLFLPERWKLSKEAEMPWKINIHGLKTCPVGDHHCLECSHAFVAQTETSIWYILVHDGYLNMFPIFPWFHSFHRVSKLQGALEIPELNNPFIGQGENQESRGGNWVAHHHTARQQLRLTWKPGFLDSSSESLSRPHPARLSIKPGDYLVSFLKSAGSIWLTHLSCAAGMVFWFHKNSSLLSTVKFSKGFLVHYESHFTDWGASADPKGQGLMALEEW